MNKLPHFPHMLKIHKLTQCNVVYNKATHNCSAESNPRAAEYNEMGGKYPTEEQQQQEDLALHVTRGRFQPCLLDVCISHLEKGMNSQILH